jgi:hypothetical protein
MDFVNAMFRITNEPLLLVESRRDEIFVVTREENVDKLRRSDTPD